jgi:hypothetical protein
MPQDESLRTAAFESARAASHRIQDAPFCRDATAIVNALHSRPWLADPLELEQQIGRFIAIPGAPEFCAVWLPREKFAYRESPGQAVRLPQAYRDARTLHQIAGIFDLETEQVQAVNLETIRDPAVELLEDDEVHVPVPQIVPLFAARLAAEAFAAGLPPRVIQSLAALAAPNPTALDTVLGRLLLSARNIGLELPPILTSLEPAARPPGVAASEGVVA